MNLGVDKFSNKFGALGNKFGLGNKFANLGDKFGIGNKFGSSYYGENEYGRPGYSDGPELGNQESGFGDNTPQPPANFATQQVDYYKNKTIFQNSQIPMNEGERGNLNFAATEHVFENKTIVENLDTIENESDKANFYQGDFNKNTGWPITFNFKKIKLKLKINGK